MLTLKMTGIKWNFINFPSGEQDIGDCFPYNAMKTRYSILLLVLLGWVMPLVAQDLPPVQNFAPSDYEAEHQNWAISQSGNKVIYVANNKGLLAFNGSAWTLYPSPNETIIRSVSVVDNRIYTGCFMEFGYWEKDAMGILHYTSLSHSIKADLLEDEEFWNILAIDDYILFQSLNRIYTYKRSENKVTQIATGQSLPKMFKVDQNIYFQKIDQGVFKIENGEEKLLYDDEVVLQDEVVSIFQKEGEILLLTRHSGFWKASGDALKRWKTKAEDLFSEISVYTGLQLADGNYVLGTISHGLIILDKNGNLLYRIDELNGLRNNTVLALFQDIDGNLWMGLDNGVSYANLDSPFWVYRDNRGIVGSVYTAVVKDDILYLGTNQGLFFKYLNDSNGFTRIAGTQGQVWSLQVFDDTLFCGHHTGTFIVEKDLARRIVDVPGTWKLGKIKGQPNKLLQGNYSGLYVLNKEKGNWQLEHKIAGFENSARFFEVFDQNIFVNHEYKGVFKVEVDPSFREVQSVKVDTSLIGANSGMIRYNNKLLYAYQEGIFEYNQDSESFIKDTVLSRAFDHDSYDSGKLVVDNTTGYLWVFTKEGIRYFTRGNLSNTPQMKRIPLAAADRNRIVGYESVVGLPEEGYYLFGTSSGYITTDANHSFEKDFTVAVAGVKKFGKTTNIQQSVLVNPAIEGKFHNEENYLEISYNVPEYNKFLKPRYQYQLTGMYPEWGLWSESAVVSFENLPYGAYEFKVRAKLGDQFSNNTATYSFNISRPWYISNMMFLAYFFTILLFSLIIHDTYRRYYRKKQQNLKEENRKELEVVRLQNDKEIIRIKNDQLKADFKNKSNELAASTMSIIKKNQLLSQVKDQLMASKDDNGSTKKIIAIIDRNLKQTDDWELFKEAFNNADRDFLKTLEKTHPNLTPNDIRLCSYLRLNLSSKEMAELLNISPRSVEIKRYRLRKKLNLMHDENLVSYMLRL